MAKVTDYEMSYNLMSYGYNFNDANLFGIYIYDRTGYRITSISYISNSADREMLNRMTDTNILPVFSVGDLLLILVGLVNKNKEDIKEVMSFIFLFLESDRLLNVVYNEITKRLK